MRDEKIILISDFLKNKFYSMRTKQVTEINVYHTPDKGSKPDLKHQSHLKTTVPSVYQTPSEQKPYSQYAAHYNKMKNYEKDALTPNVYSEKRPNKNQSQLKDKVDEYQTQISLLRQYLRSCRSDQIQTKSISRIFGFPQHRDSLQQQEQRAIKQLGLKVKGLVRENASLKSQNAHYSQLNVDQIIDQNKKLQFLLQEYKQSDSPTNNKLIEQNQKLKDEIYRLENEYEERLAFIEMDNENRLNNMKASEKQLLRKLSSMESKSKKNLRDTFGQGGKINEDKLRQIEESYTNQLKEQQIYWKEQFQEQQKYYKNIKSQIQEKNKKQNSKIQNDEVQRLRQKFSKAIQQIELEQKEKYDRLLQTLDILDKKINYTDESIEHFKFQRQNMIQPTIRKSINVAFSSVKPKGEISSQQPSSQEQSDDVEIGKKTFNNNPSSRVVSAQAEILNQKINYLQKQINELKTKLMVSEKIIGEKTEKIILLQNQTSKLNQIILGLNYNLDQAKGEVIVKQVVKEVPVKVVPREYSEEIKNIKESIIKCNLANFDVFQNEFNEIIDQRNQLNEKMVSLKKEAKDSSKVLVLQKHLKLERQRNKFLQENLKKNQQEIQNLKIQIIELHDEMSNIQGKQGRQIGSSQNDKPMFSDLPDGRQGLKWQKVVKHCLVNSVNRLENLEIKMKSLMQQEK